MFVKFLELNAVWVCSLQFGSQTVAQGWDNLAPPGNQELPSWSVVWNLETWLKWRDLSGMEIAQAFPLPSWLGSVFKILKQIWQDTSRIMHVGNANTQTWDNQAACKGVTTGSHRK